MKHPGKIEEHVFNWLNEGYTIPQIHEEMDSAIKRFRKICGYHDVDEFYKDEEMVTIETEGEDCIVTIGGVMRRLKNCNALKLANTIWNKDGEQYTREEMEEWRFVLT